MSDSNTGVTVTLKAGQGFEVPWIVIHAESVDDALKQIDTGNFATLAERTVAAAEFFRAAHNVKSGLAAAPAPAAPQQGGWNAPAQTPPPTWAQGNPQELAQGGHQPAPAAPQAGKFCTHGAMVYREGVGQKGPWKAYFCPTPKGTPGQCQAEFIR